MNERIVEQLRNISRDEDWIQRVIKANSSDELELLLKEKDITLEELRKIPVNYNQRTVSEEITESQLQTITGGGLFGNCSSKYEWLLCSFSCCSHNKTESTGPFGSNPKSYCDLGYWDYRQ